MEQQKGISRKKILLWAATILSSVAFFRILPAPQEKKETVKMLAQDGTLVEVDISKRINSRREKIDDEQLKKWVSKK